MGLHVATKNCIICGAKFALGNLQGWRVKTCSDKCRKTNKKQYGLERYRRNREMVLAKMAKPIISKICQNCGATFLAGRGHRTRFSETCSFYCSRQVKHRQRRAQHIWAYNADPEYRRRHAQYQKKWRDENNSVAQAMIELGLCAPNSKVYKDGSALVRAARELGLYPKPNGEK